MIRRPRPRTLWLAAVCVAAAVVVVAPRAQAQVMGEPESPHPDPRKFAHGLFAEAEAGTLIFLGNAAADLGPGVALGARLGYDILRFLAVQVYAGGSTHALTLGDKPQAGQLIQLYVAAAELKLSLPLSQWTLFGYGRAGLASLSTNVLGTAGVELTDPGQRSTQLFGGGVGVDYHTQSRHFSFGVSAGFAKLTRVYTTGAASAAAYVRYTF